MDAAINPVRARPRRAAALAMSLVAALLGGALSLVSAPAARAAEPAQPILRANLRDRSFDTFFQLDYGDGCRYGFSRLRAMEWADLPQPWDHQGATLFADRYVYDWCTNEDTYHTVIVPIEHGDLAIDRALSSATVVLQRPARLIDGDNPYEENNRYGTLLVEGTLNGGEDLSFGTGHRTVSWYGQVVQRETSHSAQRPVVDADITITFDGEPFIPAGSAVASGALLSSRVHRLVLFPGAGAPDRAASPLQVSTEEDPSLAHADAESGSAPLVTEEGSGDAQDRPGADAGVIETESRGASAWTLARRDGLGGPGCVSYSLSVSGSHDHHRDEINPWGTEFEETEVRVVVSEWDWCLARLVVWRSGVVEGRPGEHYVAPRPLDEGSISATWTGRDGVAGGPVTVQAELRFVGTGTPLQDRRQHWAGRGEGVSGTDRSRRVTRAALLEGFVTIGDITVTAADFKTVRLHHNQSTTRRTDRR